MTRELGPLEWVSWADTTGYAAAAKGYVRALVQSGVPVRWQPRLPGRRGGRRTPTTRTDWGDPALEAAQAVPPTDGPLVLHMLPEEMPVEIDEARAAGRRVYGYTVWELEELQPAWAPILNRLDGVMVPCSWNVEVFAAGGVEVPLHQVPHVAEPLLEPAPADREALRRRIDDGLVGRRPAPDAAVIYTIGISQVRKGIDQAVEAYLRAFAGRDDVLLVVKTGRSDLTVPWTHTWGRRRWRIHHRKRRFVDPRVSLAARAAQHPDEIGRAHV